MAILTFHFPYFGGWLNFAGEERGRKAALSSNGHNESRKGNPIVSGGRVASQAAEVSVSPPVGEHAPRTVRANEAGFRVA